MNYDYTEITQNNTQLNSIINSLQNIQNITPINTPLILIYIYIALKSELILKLLSLIHPICSVYWNELILLDIILFFISITGLFLSFIRSCTRKLRQFGRRKELDGVYHTLFSPLHITPTQFSLILSCSRNIRSLKKGESYAIEKKTRVDSLALLIQGRLLVTQSSRPLHLITSNQFVDSPEYFGVSTDDLFQVTITAMEDSRLLVWHRDKLRLTILKDDFLREMFDHVIGRDVVRKLIQVSDNTSSSSITNNIKEEQPLVNNAEEDSAAEIWSLSKITESSLDEEETCV